MPIPTWTPGQVLTASDVNSWFVPLAVVKAADESVTSSTALQNDNELLLSVAASSTYLVELVVFYEGGTQGSSDIKVGWTAPAGATMPWAAFRITTGGAFGGVYLGTLAGPSAWGSNGAGNIIPTLVKGTLTTSATSGTLQLQWAQNSSSGTATIVHANSSLTAVKVG